MTKAIILIYLVLLPLTFSVYSMDTFESPKAWLTILVAAILLPFIRPIKRVNWVDVMVGLALVSSTVSTLTSKAPYRSLVGDALGPMGWLMVASLTAIYLTARNNLTAFAERQVLFYALVVGSIPVSVYALIQVAGLDPLPYADPRFAPLVTFGVLRPFSFLGHPNDLGGYLVMLFPFALYFCMKRALASIALLLMLPVIVLTQSRGCWAAMIAVQLVMAVGSWHPSRRQAFAAVSVAWALVIFVSAVAVSLARPDLAEIFSQRLSDIASLGPAREFYWSAAWKIFKENPWLGVGTDGFRTAFEHARTPAYWAVEPAGSIGKAHNDFLNTLATQGILGGAAFIGLLVAVTTSSRKMLSRLSFDERFFTLAVVASIAGYYVQNISGFPSITTGALFMTLIATLHIDGLYSAMRWLKPAVMVAAFLTSLMFAYNFAALPMKAQSCAKAAMSASEKDPGTTIRMIDYAATIQPHDPLYPDLIGQVADSISEWNLAARGYGLAAYLEPEEAIYHFKLGTVTGNFKSIALAQLLEPANPVFDSVPKPKKYKSALLQQGLKGVL